MDTADFTMFYGVSMDNNTFGTVFLIPRKYKHGVIRFEPVSERKLCVLRLRGKLNNTTTIYDHAPTNEQKRIIQVKTLRRTWYGLSQSICTYHKDCNERPKCQVLEDGVCMRYPTKRIESYWSCYQQQHDCEYITHMAVSGRLYQNQQEVLGRNNRLLSLIRQGPHWKRSIQQLFYCCVSIRYRGNVSTEPLPSNDRGGFYRTGPLPSNDRGLHIQTHRPMEECFN
jgi:hypothetical protein